MKWLLTFILLTLSALATAADYLIAPGKMHQGGSADIVILPDASRYRVRMSYKLKTKDFVPLPKKFLQDAKVMELPREFRTLAGYQQLEKLKRMTMPKAELRFQKRADLPGLRGAYVIEVLPTNKKSRIEIVYHPSLPASG